MNPNFYNIFNDDDDEEEYLDESVELHDKNTPSPPSIKRSLSNELDDPGKMVKKNKYAAFLQSPKSDSVKLNTISGISQPATFAVWNLCDLGGGFQSAHWLKNDALKNLRGEIKKINADVLGLLEIKIGNRVAPQLPKEQPTTIAFEVGAMTAYFVYDYLKSAKQDLNLPKQTLEKILESLEDLMWLGSQEQHKTYLIKGLKSFGDLQIEFHFDDPQQLVEEMVSYSATYMNDKIINKKLKETSKNILFFYDWMSSRCKEFQNTKFKPIFFDQIKDLDLRDYQQLASELNATWKHMRDAFEYAGSIEEKEVKSEKEANGVPLIMDALEDFIKNGTHTFIVSETPKSEGETNAFIFDHTKFNNSCSGTIGGKNENWDFRSAGFLHLKGINGTLNEKEILVVLWHAPSENNVGERLHGYKNLNEKIKNTKCPDCGNKTEVILLSDMNIRETPASSEDNIISVAYNCWLPKAEYHMKQKTSVKKEGDGANKWNHPFDKVLLLKTDQKELEIGEYKKMPDQLSAKEIRIFSDHSWVSAEIIPKKNNK